MARATKPTKKPKKAAKPTRRRVSEQEQMKDQWLEWKASRDAERAKEHAARRKAASRPTLKGAKASEHQLPADVREFLLMIGPDVGWKVKLFDANGAPFIEQDVIEQANIVREAVRDAYLEGCLQGYIEGQLVYRTAAQERSRSANAAKRTKRVAVGGRSMTLNERDAAIVREFPSLRASAGSIEAQLRLAEKYGLESREQIANILRKAARARVETP